MIVILFALSIVESSVCGHTHIQISSIDIHKKKSYSDSGTKTLRIPKLLISCFYLVHPIPYSVPFHPFIYISTSSIPYILGKLNPFN